MLSKRLCCTSDTWLIYGDHQVWTCTLNEFDYLLYIQSILWILTKRIQQTRPRRTSSEGHRCSFLLRQCWPSPLDSMCLLLHFSNGLFFFQLVPMVDNPMNTTFDRKVSLNEVSVSICIFASVPLIGQLQGRTNAWPENLCWYYLWFLPSWYSGPLSKG